MKDLKSNLTVTQILDPDTVTADTNSAAVDLQDAVGCMVAVSVGESGDTLSGSVKFDLEMEESDDNATWSDVAEDDIDGALSGTTTGAFATIDDDAEDDAVYYAGYRGAKRYVRVVVNATGSHSSGTPIGAVAIVEKAQKNVQ